MPTFYNFTQDGFIYRFDDVFIPADLFRDGNLFAWGSSFRGQVGNAVTTNVSTPVTTFAGGTNWKQVSGSYNDSCMAAIKTDGTLWTWGYAAYGRLGNAVTTGSISTPVTTFAGGTNWKQVSFGTDYAAAVKTDGTLWVWGDARFLGKLGINATGNRSTPVTTFAGGTNWKQVSVGGNHAAAIKTDGTLWTWGFNGNGRLGNASTTEVSTPVTTFAGGTNWKQVSAGNTHIAAIKTDGTLWTWGDNGSGVLGNGATTGNISTPVTTFAGGTNWKQVSSGNQYTTAIKTDGTLWTWGSGNSGRLGNADIVNRSTPVTTFAGGTNWKETSGSSSIKTDGTLWVWGFNSALKLGINATGNRSTPVTTFAGGTNWKQVSLGNDTTAALTYDDPVL